MRVAAALLVLASLAVAQEGSGVKVGGKAPTFRLNNQDGKPVDLSKVNPDHWVVLSFYLKSNQPAAAEQVRSMRDVAKLLGEHKVLLYGISVDIEADQKKLWEAEQLTFDLLADAEGAVASKYGALIQGTTFCQTVTFVIDPKGTVAHIDNKVNPQTHGADLLKLAQKLQAQPPAEPEPKGKIKNMVVNGDFEGGEDKKFRGAGKGWESNDNKSHPDIHVLDSEIKHGGKFSQKIDTKGEWDHWPLKQVTGYNTITPGKKYRLVAWVRSRGNENPSTWYTVGLWWFHDDRWLCDTKHKRPKEHMTDYDWRRIVIDVEAPQHANRVGIILTAHYHGVVWYDDIEFGPVE